MATYNVNSLDTITLTDSTSFHNRYSVTCADGVLFSDSISGIITPYVKRNDDVLVMSDTTESRVDYKIRVRNNIGVSDNTQAIVRRSDNMVELIGFSDAANGGVHYGAPFIGIDTITFSDSCIGKVTSNRPFTYTNAIVAGIDNVPSTVYTVPSKTAVVLNMSLCNVSVSDITVDVAIYDGSVLINLKKDLPIGIGETFVINKNEESSFIIKQGDEVRVTSSVIDSLDVYLAIIEQ